MKSSAEKKPHNSRVFQDLCISTILTIQILFLFNPIPLRLLTLAVINNFFEDSLIQDSPYQFLIQLIKSNLINQKFKRMKALTNDILKDNQRFGHVLCWTIQRLTFLGTSISSKTPGKDFKEIERERVKNFWSFWSFWGHIFTIRHQDRL